MTDRDYFNKWSLRTSKHNATVRFRDEDTRQAVETHKPIIRSSTNAMTYTLNKLPEATEELLHPPKVEYKLRALNAVKNSVPERKLPDRFKYENTDNPYQGQVQHPFYRTSNHQYGLQKPRKRETPIVYHGIKKSFSKTFVAGGGSNYDNYGMTI